MSDSGFGPSALATPANGVTVLRLLLAPLLIVRIVEDGATWVNFALWTVLACTDGVDGWIARRQGTTRSGAFLDPLADKVLVLGALFALVSTGRFWWVPVALIAVRELAVSLWRVRLGRQGLAVPARQSGKIKVLVQGLAIGGALMPPLEDITWPADVLLWAAVVLALVSGVQYALDGARSGTAMARDHQPR
jgi:CDP-diacylglycerol---glycerol-3-phosphate 3-phosphatidyltransferase